AQRLARSGEADGGYRPDQRARRGPCDVVAAGRGSELPQRCGEARHAWVHGQESRQMSGVGMSAEALLASLMAQAEGRGVDLVTLRALVEESSQAGARRA